MSEDARRDAIAETIHAELQSWLQDTANTATSLEGVSDLTTGAVSALFCFLWANRPPGQTRERIIAAVASMGGAVLAQLPDGQEPVQ